MSCQDTKDPGKCLPVLFADSKAPTMVIAVICPTCGCIVFSRCKTDLRNCICGSVSIDGGPVGDRIHFRVAKGYELYNVQIMADLDTLYYDWNLAIDRFGILFPKGNKKTVTSWKYVLSITDMKGVVLYQKQRLDEEESNGDSSVESQECSAAVVLEEQGESVLRKTEQEYVC